MYVEVVSYVYRHHDLKIPRRHAIESSRRRHHLDHGRILPPVPEI